MYRGRPWQEAYWLAEVARCRPLPVDVARDVFGYDGGRLPNGSPLLVPRLVAPIAGGSKAGYSTSTEAAVALSAATAKTILGVKSASGFGLDWRGYMVGFDGVTANAVPVLIELGYCTWGANSPGTNSTSTTADQVYGRSVTVGATAAKNWTTEPTTITPLYEYLLTPAAGLVIYDWSLGESPDSAVSEGFCIRCNAPAAVNVRGTMDWERC